MERMEHFRNARLVDGDNEALAGIEGYLGFHVKSQGRKQWYGYFELTKDQHVAAGAHYTLVLTDGRAGEIHAADVRSSDAPNKNVHIAEFYVIGEFKIQRRGLKEDAAQQVKRLG